MGADCCGHSATFEGLSADYKRRLWLVIAINASMFLVEMGAGALAGSQALQADALDFLGDATTYGISLAVIGASIQIRARRNLEGSEPNRDGSVGSRLHRVSRSYSWRAACRNHGCHWYFGVSSERGECSYSHALQRRRCKRALCLVVFSE